MLLRRQWFGLMVFALAAWGCKEAPTPPPDAAAPAVDPTSPFAAAPRPPADVLPGEALGALRLGAPPPSGPEGRRALADGREVLYWSELGLAALVGKDGKVVGAAAHGPTSDPFFRRAYEGKSAEGIGLGASAAEVRAKLGPCQAVPRPSPFVAGRIVLTCKPDGLSLDLSGEGGAVIALRVGAEVW